MVPTMALRNACRYSKICSLIRKELANKEIVTVENRRNNRSKNEKKTDLES